MTAAFLPATAGATLLAVLLSFALTHPVRRLTREMERLASAPELEPDAPGLPAQRPLPPSATATRTALTTHGPAETRSLAGAFYRLLDRVRSDQQRLAQSERLATLGKLSLSVAHELRNPLSGIKMNVRVLQDRVGQDDDPGIAAIEREIDRMGLYLDELMSLAPAGKPDAVARARQPAGLQPLAESVLTLLAARCRHARVSVETAFEGGVARAAIDPNQIRQVMINFIVNAIEAMPTGGALRVTITPGERISSPADAPATTRFAVSDTGSGVAAAGDVFEAFVTGKPNGVGLGLYVSRQIIRQHGGRVGYENLPRGARFWFELPVVHDDSAFASPTPAPAGGAT